MKKLKVLDLFSGIGGFSLGLERTGGFETVAFCEIDKHAIKVLQKNWPDIAIIKDINKLKIQTLNHIKNLYRAEHMASFSMSAPPLFNKIDVICGGFPCQDISIGGKGKGLKDENGNRTRSGLWEEYYRLIKEIKPKYAIVENVERLRKKGLGIILNDLAKIGYDAEWHCITAKSVGYPHQRDRLFLIAYPCSKRQNECLREKRYLQTDEERKSQEIYKKGERCEFESGEICPILSRGAFDRLRSTYTDEGTALSKLRRVTNGIPEGMDETRRKRRIVQLGNTIVPRITEIIGNAILEREKNAIK